MAVFRCKMCGGTLEITSGSTTATCEYCGSVQTLPRLDDDKIARLYDHADHYRRNDDFDKAMEVYEKILLETPEDAEAYWSLVLCRYGIEYVEDPTTKQRIPTVNRVQYTSVFDDDNYRSALKFADASQRAIYEKEAETINTIQKGILEISQKEEPFDVFICYKESDERGQRTRDSVYANDLYHELTQEGFKVFYARITLESKLGEAYEPYIFAALNSAKVMVVLGTKPEFFNAVWVKNEWSRYLALIKNGAKKKLIPAYSGMDPYDLPSEFAHLQALDMTKLGFMPDLVRGIKKIIGVEAPVAAAPAAHNDHGHQEVELLLKRVHIFMESEDWLNADIYCEKVLDADPENPDAYFYKFLTQMKVDTLDKLEDHHAPLDQYSAYRNAVRYADERKSQELIDMNNRIRERLDRIEAERRHQQELQDARDRQLNALNEARNNAATMVQSYVAQRDQIQEDLNSEQYAYTNNKKYTRGVRIRSVLVLILVALMWIAFAATSESNGDDGSAALLSLSFIAMLIVNYNLHSYKASSGCLSLVLGMFTIGIYPAIYALISLFGSGKRQQRLRLMRIQNLGRQLQEVNASIATTTQSLNEINQKIENF